MELINNQIPLDLILEQLKKQHVPEIIEQSINKIDFNLLPNYPRHNISHYINVGLYSLLLANYYNIDNDLKKILLDASILHDVGRIDDCYDYNHAYIGSVLVDLVVEKQNFYQEKNNLLLLKTLILGHSRNICDLSIFSKYHIKRSEDNLKLLKILKDADMLDAFRLDYFKINIK